MSILKINDDDTTRHYRSRTCSRKRTSFQLQCLMISVITSTGRPRKECEHSSDFIKECIEVSKLFVLDEQKRKERYQWKETRTSRCYTSASNRLPLSLRAVNFARSMFVCRAYLYESVDHLYSYESTNIL